VVVNFFLLQVAPRLSSYDATDLAIIIVNQGNIKDSQIHCCSLAL